MAAKKPTKAAGEALERVWYAARPTPPPGRRSRRPGAPAKVPKKNGRPKEWGHMLEAFLVVFVEHFMVTHPGWKVRRAIVAIFANPRFGQAFRGKEIKTLQNRLKAARRSPVLAEIDRLLAQRPAPVPNTPEEEKKIREWWANVNASKARQVGK